MSDGEETRAERLESAVASAMREYGGRDFAAVKAIVAGLTALAEEFGPRVDGNPGAEPGPVRRELPTERGAVVLATEIRGVRFNPPLLAIRGEREEDTSSVQWWTIEGVGPRSYIWHASADITRWLPARVVRDDEWGPVTALHRIATETFDARTPADEQVDYLRTLAKDALEALDERGAAAVTT